VVIVGLTGNLSPDQQDGRLRLRGCNDWYSAQRGTCWAIAPLA